MADPTVAPKQHCAALLRTHTGEVAQHTSRLFSVFSSLAFSQTCLASQIFPTRTSGRWLSSGICNLCCRKTPVFALWACSTYDIPEHQIHRQDNSQMQSGGPLGGIRFAETLCTSYCSKGCRRACHFEMAAVLRTFFHKRPVLQTGRTKIVLG